MTTGPAPYYQDELVRLHLGDCLDILPELPDNSVDAVVTDPPYGLEFMGKEWDRFTPSGLRDGFDRITAPTWSRGAWQNKRCTNCGHIASGGSPCRCLNPIWTVETGKSNSAAYAFQAWCTQWAAECLRILKPGGHLLAFGGTRTSHRLACAIEDAGFEIRDGKVWIYGQGFPKSLDVSKAIDAQLGRESAPPPPTADDAGQVGAWLREQCNQRGISSRDINEHFAAANVALRWLLAAPTETKRPQVPKWDQWAELCEWLELPDTMDAEVWRLNGLKGTPTPLGFEREPTGAVAGRLFDQWEERTRGASTAPNGRSGIRRDNPATPEAAQWQGWGTSLKPAHEPIVVARKPLTGTVAANVLRWGTGALNIDACRIGTEDELGRPFGYKTWMLGGCSSVEELRALAEVNGWCPDQRKGSARTVLAYHEEQTARLNETRPEAPHGRWPANVALDESQAAALDQQSGERPTSDPGAVRRTRPTDPTAMSGSHGVLDRAEVAYGDTGGASRFFYTAKASSDERITHNGVSHATVKPLSLMRWLVRLVTPPGGVILEPFAGSGTTVEAAMLEGFRCIAIEREADYLPLITQRINRRRDPIAYIKAAGEDLGLFGDDTA